jgi:hypothetical protein
MPKPHKVPRVVHLPGGYSIDVHLLSRKKANEEMGSDVYAQWDVSEHAIYLRAERKGKDRAEDFIHELEHAFVDYKDWFLGKTETE